MDNNTIALIGIGIKFVIRTVNLVFSIVTSRKTIYVNTVTSLRSKWLDQMKTCLADFIALISDSVNNNRNIDGEKDRVLKFELEKIYRKIEINVNPLDEYDEPLLYIIK